MADITQPTAAPLLAADGTPLRRKLEQAMFLSRMRALGLVAPLLAFILAVFIVPILYFMIQGMHNPVFADRMPTSTPLLQDWDGQSPVTEAMAAAMVQDLIVTRDNREIGRVATRVNQEYAGARSMFTSSARKAEKMQAPFLEALVAADKDWGKPEVWRAIKVAARSWTPAYYLAALDLRYSGDGSVTLQPEGERIYVALFVRTMEISLIVTLSCFALGYPVAWLLAALPVRRANLLMILVLLPFWTSILVRTTAWIAMLQGQGVMNDLMVFTGINQVVLQISLLFNDYADLSVASLCGVDVTAALSSMSGAVEKFATTPPGTLTRCATEILGAFEQGGAAAAQARAEALAASAQSWGYGDERFSMIYNKLGTVIAMTHILLPFMILPLYSVMKTVPPSYLRAAKSMGATNWTAFWRVYFPQTVPGIGAGALLVFILAIGYYITPALVGGQDGQMISNFIDFHMRRSLNWSLAAALGGVLLVVVLFFYWLYDRIVGIDNMKFG
ncbi:MAG: ABC transporter permease [Thermohalobaculum sp.]|nr:ABC transporter permease [Thermohalobaculum sp.]